ncbi:MAG: GDSL family lipase, partial [Anaerolineae bacterium]|nr:GDSL family lipase [Anaerolineae bacterium]
NRGISGNRAVDLHARWKADCLELHPDWVSILIGINDTWRRYDSHDPMPLDGFAQHYRAVLEKTRRSGAQIIVLEPFLLPIPEDRRAWREDLDPKIQVVRDLAREFASVYVPLDGIFAAASVERRCDFWLPDGVHPSQAGHALIAQHWLKAVGA